MAEETILDADKRLSHSLLWKLQGDAYTQFGIEAWSQQGVPFYITSNPFTAKQYAHVVLGYLRDCLASIDHSQPIYILDLGAGTGRFAYLFLKELLGFLHDLSLGIPICYVMTDIVPANFDFWKKHPKLQPFFEKGILDYAYYHHAQNTPIRLMRSRKNLTNLVNPLILIGNYFFDTIPQDLFRVQEGALEEGRVTLSLEKGIDKEAPSLINHLKTHYAYIPIEAEDYYPAFLEVNPLLSFYLKKLGDYPFLFPIGAFQSLHYFKALSNGRLLLLAGDQGVCTLDQIRAFGEPKLSLHGTFSISVNYQAIAQYFSHQHGIGLLTSFSDPAFVVMAGVLSDKQGNFDETQLAFRRHLDAFEPSDYWKLTTYVEEKARLEECLLMLQLGNGDPMSFHAFFPKILKQLPESTDLKKRLMQAIEKAWEHFYPISAAEGDFILNLGVLYFEMGHYDKALKFFERSLAMTGEKSITRNNIEACKKKLLFKRLA